jgi:hypothetical protein
MMVQILNTVDTAPSAEVDTHDAQAVNKAENRSLYAARAAIHTRAATGEYVRAATLLLRDAGGQVTTDYEAIITETVGDLKLRFLARDFFQNNREELRLRLVGKDVGFARKISEPSVNRPGLLLAGFDTYFAYKRVQVIGNSECSFLEGLQYACM